MHMEIANSIFVISQQRAIISVDQANPIRNSNIINIVTNAEVNRK